MNINSDEDSNSLFNVFLDKSSSISYVASGAGGIGLEVFNTDNKTYNILSTDNENVVCSKLFIKLIPISNVKPIKQIIQYSSVLVYSSSSTQFSDEVNIQNKIYKISNSGLEAICPPIINAQIHDNDKSEEFIDLLIGKTDNKSDSIKNGLLSMLKENIKADRGIRLGVIAMGFTENYISLHNAIQIYPKERTDYFKKLAVYELIRLYDLGYLHGDFSLSNILINPDYNYTETNRENDKGRAMLIDFGASFPVPPRSHGNVLSIKDKIDIMLDTPVKYLNNIIPRTPGIRRTSGIHHTPGFHVFGFDQTNNWSWLNLFSKTIDSSVTQLFSRIVRYNRIMILMIKHEYPDIYNKIIQYNNVLDDIVVGDLDDIVVGGGYPPDNKFNGILPLTNNINDNTEHIRESSKNMKNDTEERDIEKMKAIFNPNNLDIEDIGNKYLDTLKLMKNTKLMKKGGRKRKHIRHKKTNKRKHKKCKNNSKRKKRK